ncbi:hypothetical protein ASG25_04075 [Rhizobium sp. Leaf384]|nr:hypothetical protein ASG58_10250 [Rhizobium sp. Leaf383]KQS80731.1 hypothetical protein ASG25_04075 [Rhizobium sp. Leaf384]
MTEYPAAGTVLYRASVTVLLHGTIGAGRLQGKDVRRSVREVVHAADLPARVGACQQLTFT